MVADMFESLGVSSSVIYPLAIAKLLGLVAIWTNKSRLLKELAYGGFILDLCSASVAHYLAEDSTTAIVTPLFFLIPTVLSFIYHKKVFVQEK